MHLALIHQAFLALVYKFDGVFNRQNMPVFRIVLIIDHGGQRCRLTRTCGAGHQHDTARVLRNLLEYCGRVEIFQRQDLGRDSSKNSAGTAIMIERINTKTRKPGNFE